MSHTTKASKNFKIRLNRRTLEIAKPYFFLIPALFMVGTFLAYPAFRTIIISFTEWNGVTKPIFVGFNNFFKLFSYPELRVSLSNTLYWGISTLTLPVVMSLFLALLINRASGSGLFKVLIFLPIIHQKLII